MQYGRFLSFLFILIAFGPIQLWILLLVLNTTSRGTITIGTILGDGGLFFYATTVAVGSAISLFDKKQFKIGSSDFNVTLICCIAPLIVIVIYYSSILTQTGLSTPRPFNACIFQQLGCTLMALIYWLYVGTRTGLFVKEENDNT